MTKKLNLMDLLSEAVRQGASDLHLVSGLPPALRVAGRSSSSGVTSSTPRIPGPWSPNC